jgi:Cu(I)/Ag(I) efflux system membrane fusion protein
MASLLGRVARAALVRLRFIALTAAAALCVAYADDIPALARRLVLRAPAAAVPAAPRAEHFCPMHPGVVRGEAGTCPLCGMALSKREEAPALADPRVQLSPEGVRLAGVATAAVERRALHRRLEAAATVEYDERRIVRVSTRFKGRIDRLYVDATGARVRRGQPLASLYVPELVAPARELLKARKAGGEQFAIVQQQLKLWGLGQDQIDRILASGDATHVDFNSPIGGTVVAKNILLGDSVMDGAALFTVADLSLVWAVARLYEEEAAAVRPGQRVTLSAAAYPERTFEGRVSFVEPEVNRETRTVGARIELDNQQELLRPGMFLRAQLELASGDQLAVPASAIVDAGERRLVWRERGEGAYEPVAVVLGSRAGDLYAVVSGLAEGDRVVTQGAFLVDAEARLHGAAR